MSAGASDTQGDKLDALWIEDWFDAIVISGELGSAKPDVTAFQTAPPASYRCGSTVSAVSATKPIPSHTLEVSLMLRLADLIA